VTFATRSGREFNIGFLSTEPECTRRPDEVYQGSARIPIDPYSGKHS
jgi:hypothetical protein